MFAHFIKIPIFLLRCTAIWDVEFKNKYYHFLYYTIYTNILRYVLHIGNFVSFVIHIRMVDDLEAFAKNVSILAIVTFVSFKWFYFRRKINRIYEFVEKLNAHSAEPRDDDENA